MWAAEARGFAAREPRRRPFRRSVALAPRKARCLVNLSGVQAGQTLLDPFCGTGSIPIEAALMGVRTVAADVDPVVVAGAARNFAALSLGEIDRRRAEKEDGGKRRVYSVRAAPRTTERRGRSGPWLGTRPHGAH